MPAKITIVLLLAGDPDSETSEVAYQGGGTERNRSRFVAGALARGDDDRTMRRLDAEELGRILLEDAEARVEWVDAYAPDDVPDGFDGEVVAFEDGEGERWSCLLDAEGFLAEKQPSKRWPPSDGVVPSVADAGQGPGQK